MSTFRYNSWFLEVEQLNQNGVIGVRELFSTNMATNFWPISKHISMLRGVKSLRKRLKTWSWEQNNTIFVTQLSQWERIWTKHAEALSLSSWFWSRNRWRAVCHGESQSHHDTAWLILGWLIVFVMMKKKLRQKIYLSLHILTSGLEVSTVFHGYNH